MIAVNGWMNHPDGLRHADGHVVDVHPVDALFGNSFFWHELVHMYIAGYIVTGFLVAGAYALARLRGQLGPLRAHGARDPADDRRARLARAGARRRLGGARGRRRAQPVKLAAFEGLAEDR